MGTPEQINTKYEPRIRKILTAIGEALREDGWKVGEICDMTDMEYRYAVLASQHDADPPKLLDDDVDITFEICESEESDGSENGVTFSIQIVKVGGEMLGGLSPYNYTEGCWVPRDNDDAIEERFAILEQSDPSEVVCLLEDYKAY